MRVPNSILLVVTFAACLLNCGCGAAVTHPADDSRRRYHDGHRWVEVLVLLDRLYVERNGMGGEAGRREAYLLRTPVTSVTELESVARQMTAAQTDIRVVSAYVRPTNDPGSEPQRVSRQIAVIPVAGADVNQLLARHGVRVIEALDYLPGALVGEIPASDGLLASFEYAEAIRTDANVAAAFPLLQRSLSLRRR